MSDDAAALRAGFGRSWLVARLPVPVPADRRRWSSISFNNSRSATVWSGFSLEWYRKLANDHEIIAGLWLSLEDRRSVSACVVGHARHDGGRSRWSSYKRFPAARCSPAWSARRW